MDQDNDKLVIRDIPVMLWIVGVLAAVYAAYAYVQAPGQLIPPAIGAAVCLAILLFSSVLTVSADRRMGTLTLRHTSLLRRKVREIAIADIAALELEVSHSSSRGRSSTTYRIAVYTKGGEVIPFRSYYSSGRMTHESKARRLREFLGISGQDMSLAGMFQMGSAMAAEEFRKEQESITGSQDEEHVTDGVRWKLQTRATGGAPISIWQSPDFQWPGQFLYLAQKVPGQSSTGGLMAMMGKMLLKTSLGIYGFTGEMTPGVATASQLAPLDPQIEPYFFAFTSDPTGARQILNPWVHMPLAAWAQKNPMKQVSTGTGNQLAVLYGPQGVSIAMLGLTNPEFLEEITRLGVELVKAQGGAR